jgi:hypothetical protein
VNCARVHKNVGQHCSKMSKIGASLTAHFHNHNHYMNATVVQCSEFLATDPEVRFRFPALLDFLRSSGSGTGSTWPREYNCGAAFF